MNSLLLVIAQLCQINYGSNFKNMETGKIRSSLEIQLSCQQDLIKCVKKDMLIFESSSYSENKLAQCVLDGVHISK